MTRNEKQIYIICEEQPESPIPSASAMFTAFAAGAVALGLIPVVYALSTMGFYAVLFGVIGIAAVILWVVIWVISQMENAVKVELN